MRRDDSMVNASVLELRSGSQTVTAGTLDDLCVSVARGVRGDSVVSYPDRSSVRFKVDPDRRALVYVPKESA